MYAIIEQGGRQEMVSEGDRVRIDLTGVEPGAKSISIEKVLFVSDGEDFKVGEPYIKGATVIASFETSAAEGVVKGKKLYPTHFRRRKNSKTRVGHRQKYFEVVIEKINA